jgi:hypothetical protein
VEWTPETGATGAGPSHLPPPDRPRASTPGWRSRCDFILGGRRGGGQPVKAFAASPPRPPAGSGAPPLTSKGAKFGNPVARGGRPRPERIAGVACLGPVGRRWGHGGDQKRASGAKSGGGETVFRPSGCCFRRSRVPHRSGGQEVAGSNPASPTIRGASRSGICAGRAAVLMRRRRERGGTWLGVVGDIAALDRASNPESGYLFE